jgi:hypothetical protein
VALVLDDHEPAGRPPSVQLPGRRERTAHVEPTVDQHRREVGDRVQRVEDAGLAEMGTQLLEVGHHLLGRQRAEVEVGSGGERSAAAAGPLVQ